MSASSRRLPPRAVRGFSLVELLVAVMFTSLLMAGMFRVFAASTSAFAAGNETLSVQRKARWGVALLQDEILQSGFVLPKRTRPPGMLASATAQPPLMMRLTDYVPTGADGAVDELQVVMDIPLTLDGTLTAPFTGGTTTTAAVNIPAGTTGIQENDVLFLKDGNAELLSVQSVSGSNILIKTFTGDASGEAGSQDAYGNLLFEAQSGRTHLAGTPFSVVRPAQIVRYTVVPRALDPANPAALVPCLVRQSRPLATAPGEIWSPGTAVQAGEQILLENVVGFTVDWSLDGGRNWLRGDFAAGDDWLSISGVLQQKVLAHPSSFVRNGLGTQGIFNPSIPMWTLFVPMVIRIDLTTRSEMQRTEFNRNYDPNNPVATYRLRRETILLAPRNFAIDVD